MTQQTIEIEGLPEGWNAVAYRCPKSGEYYLENNGVVRNHTGCKHKFPWIIVEKIQPRRKVLEETDRTQPVINENGNPQWFYLENKWWKEVKE